MIELTDIHFLIKNKPLLKQINLNIAAGEVTVILGPNGAGKSSLLRVVSKELRPQSGQIKYNGENIKTIGTCMLSRIRAVMSQHSHIVFPFSVEKVVELGAIPHESKRNRTAMLREVMELTDTWKFREREIQSLSGGERQRVHFARVLLQIWEPKPYPRFLLLDEPTSSMDIAQQHQLLQMATKLKHQNIGIMAILHDLNLAAQYADKIVLMRAGKIICSGSAHEVLQPKWLSQTYEHPLSVIYNPENNKPVIISGTYQNQAIKSFQTA